ncbi:Hypothetical protein PBC10988_7200 [Planctomycetales bacterium 10988]|nr:Hypothetical protein PBC10988_7200 [Planctomycetales bacterium 10988]
MSLLYFPNPLDSMTDPTHESVADLYQRIEKLKLLSAEQLPELHEAIDANQDWKRGDLALWLEERDWITPWQRRRLVLGKGSFWWNECLLKEPLGQEEENQSFLAHHAALRSKVILQVLPSASQDANPEEAEKAEESRAFWSRLFQLRHPSIAAIYSLHEETTSQKRWLVKEYFPEGSLAEELESEKIEVEWLGPWLRTIAEGLAYAHQEGFVHRGISPSRIFLLGEQKQQAKLAFGSSTLFLDPSKTSTVEDEDSEEEMVVPEGTIDYLSPEQAEDPENVDGRSDLFSLGCVAYHLLTKRLPFTGKNKLQKLLARARKDAPPANQHRADLPKPVVEILSKLLARDPQDRYESAEELIWALQAWPAAWPRSGGVYIPCDRVLETRKTVITESLPEELLQKPEEKSETISPPPLPADGKKKAQPQATPSTAKQDFDLEELTLQDDDKGTQSAQAKPATTKVNQSAASTSGSSSSGDEELFDLLPVDEDKKRTVVTASTTSKPEGEEKKEEETPENQLFMLKGRRKGDRPGGIQSVTFLPGEKQALSAGTHAVQLWNLEKGREIRQLIGHKESVESVSVSADGKFAATGGWDRVVRVWDLETGRQIRHLEGHEDAIFHVRFMPQDNYLLSAGRDRSLRIWDLQESRMAMWMEHSDWIRAIGVPPDGSFVVLAGGSNELQDYTVRVWELSSSEELRVLAGHRAPIWSLALSPDGTRAVSGGEDGSLFIWDLHRGTLLGRVAAHQHPITTVAVTTNGRWIASGSEDHVIKIWHAVDARQVETFVGHREAVASIAFSPNNLTLLSGGADNTVRLWKMNASQWLRNIRQ